MNNEEFIKLIKLVVRNVSVDGIIENLERPPGRKIVETEQALSRWFNSLPGKDRAFVETVVAMAVDEAIFGLLAVIDGVRAIESGPKKGRLELKYIGRKEKILNDPKGSYLHDIYNATK